MALVGSESEDVQKALLKVQGAMALAQGLSQLKDFGKSWQQVNIFIKSNTIFMKANAAATALTANAMKVGDVVTVENVAAHYNGGNKTITKVTDYSISYVISHVSTELKHLVRPYGTISAATNVDYATIPEVRQASAMLAASKGSPYRKDDTAMLRQCHGRCVGKIQAR